MAKVLMTVRGRQKLEARLKHLLEKERPAIIKAVQEARAHGDLSENAEYSAAREKQAFIDKMIAKLTKRLEEAEVVDPKDIKEDKIVFGATVTLENLETGDIVTYQIVGEDEADVDNGLISFLSPFARSLIGKKEGDVVVIKKPRGEEEYEIVKVEYK